MLLIWMNFLNLLLATAPLAHLWSILVSLLTLGPVVFLASTIPPEDYLAVFVLNPTPDYLAVLFLASGDLEEFLLDKLVSLSFTFLAPQHENILKFFIINIRYLIQSAKIIF